MESGKGAGGGQETNQWPRKMAKFHSKLGYFVISCSVFPSLPSALAAILYYCRHYRAAERCWWRCSVFHIFHTAHASSKGTEVKQTVYFPHWSRRGQSRDAGPAGDNKSAVSVHIMYVWKLSLCVWQWKVRVPRVNTLYSMIYLPGRLFQVLVFDRPFSFHVPHRSWAVAGTPRLLRPSVADKWGSHLHSAGYSWWELWVCVWKCRESVCTDNNTSLERKLQRHRHRDDTFIREGFSSLLQFIRGGYFSLPRLISPFLICETKLT